MVYQICRASYRTELRYVFLETQLIYSTDSDMLKDVERCLKDLNHL